MIYTAYVIFFLIVCTAVFLAVNFYKQNLVSLYYRLSIKNLIAKQRAKSGEFFFNSLVIRQIISYLVGKRDKGAKKALIDLSEGKSKTALDYLEKKRKHILAANLLAFSNPKTAIRKLEKIVNENPNDYMSLANLGALYFNNHEVEQAINIFEKMDEKKARSYVAASKLYYLSLDMIKDGKMLEASQYLSRSIALFNKEKAYFEVTKAYSALGTIYRVTAVNDVAQVMFQTALEISKRFNILDSQADALGNIGMLMMAQERFEESQDYFGKAEKLNNKINRKIATAEILNQQALLMTVQKKNKEARKMANNAIELHKKLGNNNGQALGWDILSFVNQNENKFESLIKSAKKALSLYDKIDNFDAWLEASYMHAFALFKERKIDEAEFILRNITEEAKKKPSCFHVANAYNMLGLIFLQKGDLKRSKGLFQQAASLEEKNERFCSAATDYANIALIEKRSGNIEQSRKTLELAITYAKVSEDQDLYNILKEQLDKANYN